MSTTVLTRFEYTALDTDGTTIKGWLEAESEAGVRETLAGRSLTPVSVGVRKRAGRREIHLPGTGKRVRVKDLAVFARQFESMVAAGLPLLRAIEVIEDQADRADLKQALVAVKTAVRAGVPLSDALEQHPTVFPPLMVSMVRSGEAGGFLDQALDRVAAMYEAEAKLRSKVRSALAYPAVVLCFAMLLVGGLLVFVVPIFETMFSDLGGSLPAPTRALIALSDNIWWVAPAVIAAAAAGWRGLKRRYRASQTFRAAIDRRKLALPILGGLLTKVALGRWARTLSTLLHVGVPLPLSLDIVGAAAGNETVAAAMRQVGEAVRSGGQMSDTLHGHDLFPSLATQMVATGEESGRLPDMLTRLADYYDREIESSTDSLTSLIEPVMVMLLGGVVGSVVVCLYLPMFTIYQNIG